MNNSLPILDEDRRELISNKVYDYENKDQKPKKSRLKKTDSRPKCETENCVKIAVFNKFFNKERYCKDHYDAVLYDEFYPKCISCERRIIEDVYRGNELKPELNKNEIDKYGRAVEFVQYSNVTRDGKEICEDCIGDDLLEPESVVRFMNDNNDDLNNDDLNNNDDVIRIGYYTSRYESQDDIFEDNDPSYDEYFCFTAQHKQTDGWRSYTTVSSNKYVEIIDDNILAYSEDSHNLKKFDDLLIELLVKKNHLRLARVISRSSNIFSQGYQLFIHKEDLKLYKKLLPQIEKLKIDYRDEGDYIATALGHKN